MQTTATLSTHVLKKAIDHYYKQLQDYKGRADYELAVRTAFLNLLAETAHQVKWMLIPEQTIEGGNPKAVSDLLTQFFTYTEPDIATFEEAVQEFKERVPELARALLAIIELRLSMHLPNCAARRLTLR